MIQFFSQRIWLQTSFKLKLVLSLSIVILIVFCLSGYISYRIHLTIFEKEVSEQFSKANEQALARLELRIQDIYRISDYVVFNPYVKEIIMNSSGEEPGSQYEQYLDRVELNELLNKVKLDAPQLRAMYLYNLKGEGVYYNNTLSVNKFGEEEYRRIVSRLEGTDGGILWGRMSLPSAIEPSGFRNMIVASRLMKTPELVTYGSMVMVFDEALFANFLTSLTAKETGRVYLFGPNDQMLYTDETNTDRIPNVLLQANGQQTDFLTVEDIPYLYTRSSSDNTYFSLVSRISLQDIQERSQTIFQVALYSGVLSIVLAGILVTITSQQLLRPLRSLVKGMHQLRLGNFDTRIDIQTKDELSYIGQSFNSMAENINSLIKEVYERQLNEKQAELRALQAQLNPHFLYNTLDMIYWRLYLKDDMETAKLIVSLSDLLRYALEPVDETITLKDEIYQIQNYFTIQKARFTEDLETDIRIEDNVGDCHLIRLLLQPLVENIFVHAFRDKETDRVIRICAYREADRLLIEIADNGCGMDAATVERLRQRTVDNIKEDGREHLGIRSVIRRIDLVYGEPYGVEISSCLGEGTMIRLVLPYFVQTPDGKDDFQ